ncbi:PAB-dependent poly(A)-specific ribonuclease subunit PAN2 [Lineolata rhizophorae]|uniref:PAN2-PAN3 deadenylation complex catalytic subunit PAN2 n=1 Tax=Lineolata rhizophorae TaxID=578093 RepID=A0A6A6NPT1_9PEZI|nr:PAB-dependent poly(A)-specific ribonuclease subunit PAN2 [Lineolata rhizophorae]
MEADWDEISRVGLPPPGPHALPTAVSVLAFDTSQELLWAGNEFGRLTSFYGPELQKYTSFRAHPPADGAGVVKQLLFSEKGVLSVASRSVHFALRRGPAIWHLTNEAFKDLRCMSFTSKGTHEVLVAGGQDTMVRIDVEKGTITETLPSQDNYTIMKRGGQYICAATSTGSVHILDPSSFKLIKSWKAHNGWINDMDAKSDFLVTCGFSPRQQHGYMLDPLANVFDLKSLMPLPPIPFHPGAAFVRMHPRMSTTSVVASQSGQLQVIDIMNPNTANLRQANIFETYLTALEMAPSGEALALADAHCAIHLWGSPAKIQFAEYAAPTDFADTHAVLPPPSLDWFASEQTPYHTVGLPHYRDTLLSAWPSHMVFEVGAPTPKIDPQILASLKRDVIGAYAPFPRDGRRRNQVEDTRRLLDAERRDALAAPRFLSEVARERLVEGAGGAGDRRLSDALDALGEMVIDGADGRVMRTNVPVMYRNVEIKYSKFGIEDFDFKYYNRTEFSGLETHIANSYANPLLQLYRFTPLIRNLALRHTATSCLYENCILCEMGFLIDMLEKASGQNCQATNFLRTLSGHPTAAQLGLLEEHSLNGPLSAVIQSLNRFLLDQMAKDYRQMSPQMGHMEQILATAAVTATRCPHCANEVTHPGAVFVHELLYPPKSAGGGPHPHHPRHPHGAHNSPRQPRPSFSQILKASVERQKQVRGWCTRCRRYLQLAQRLTIQGLPQVLVINAAVDSGAAPSTNPAAAAAAAAAAGGTSEAKQLWSTHGWLPHEIGIIVEQGQFFCYEGQDLQFHLQRKNFPVTEYELVGVVADINSGVNEKPHLVSLVNVAPSSPNPETQSEWYLFNDFLVRQTSPEEALRFDATWKLPSILTYQMKSARHNIDNSWKQHLDTSLLYHRWPAPTPPRQLGASTTAPSQLEPLRPLDPQTEAPQPGTLAAIDAEFVALQREEISIKADGTRETVRPPRLGLARVSVVRGGGVLEGTPFIDDYIAVPEPVVDYLTQYSGIAPGDLDRATSKHALVPRKAAYKKLWLLLNLGAVFVGHGLAKDFRTINMHVPSQQVIDTVLLFHIPARQRRLNLRFLAWCLLREHIQTREHDSVEDACTALRLYRKYQEFVDAGVLDRMLADVYARGREVGWKAPNPSPSPDPDQLAAAAAAAAAAASASATPEPSVGPAPAGADPDGSSVASRPSTAQAQAMGRTLSAASSGLLEPGGPPMRGAAGTPGAGSNGGGSGVGVADGLSAPGTPVRRGGGAAGMGFSAGRGGGFGSPMR